MREELKNFNWHTYGLDLSDFDLTLTFMEELFEARELQLKMSIDEMRSNNEYSEDDLGEIISDRSYYSYVDDLLIYQYTLWRIQAVFEGIIKMKFFPDKKLIGLKKKLDYIINKGYDIDSYDDILEWGKLRNALSHYPTERYRHLDIKNDDVIEFCDLLKQTILNLLNQKKHQ